jgi:predicted GNAT family N-acyltransferase
VEFGRLSMRDWAQLVEGECEPFGPICAGFEFRPKDHHVGIRDAAGRLVAAAGWSLVDVEIAGAGDFQVVGIGALIVRRDLRGSGLAEPIMDRVRDQIRGGRGAYRMLLCEPHLEPMYARRGYRPVEDPVWVDQSAGPVRWPLSAMWAPLISSVGWPAGAVHIQGLPF